MPREYVTAFQTPTLPIRTADVISLGPLPDIHKDPFDRILVAQCISEGIPLVTKDERLRLYGIQTIW
jgi:PIN domain nuclease of toxin-antitoxin system